MGARVVGSRPARCGKGGAMRSSTIVMVATFGAIVLAGTVPVSRAQQQPEAKGVVAVRQQFMDSFGGHAGAIQKILTQYPQLADQIPLHAAAIASLAPDIPSMFPEGSLEPPSNALPEIWKNKADFDAKAKNVTE